MKILEFAFVTYPVTDMVRARAFYEGALGLSTASPDDDYTGMWVEYEIGPHTLALISHPEMKPSSDGPTLALEVDDLDEAITHLKSKEVKFQMDLFDTPVCRMATIFDPDGNKIIVHKRKA